MFDFQQYKVTGSGLAPAGKPGVGKGKGKILKLLISFFLFSSPGSLDQDWHRLASRGWARGKVRDNYFFFSFQKTGVAGSGLAPAGKPGWGRGKARYLSYLFLVFFSAVQGHRIRIGTGC